MHASTDLHGTDAAYEMFTAKLGASPTGTLCIHTQRASLKLDGHGICVEAFTLDGSTPEDLERFVGSQFVASVDGDSNGLNAQPNVGSHALLVEGAGTSTPSLLKTTPITGVVYDHDLIKH